VSYVDSEQIACPHCGVLLDDLQAYVDGLLFERHAMQETNTKQLARIKSLTRDKDMEAHRHRHYLTARQILFYWQQECHPDAREVESRDRLKAVLDRLDGGYEPWRLMDAVRGYSKFPFLVSGRRVADGAPAQRKVDAELIFRSPRNVDTGIDLYAQSQQFKDVLADPTRNGGDVGEIGKMAVRYAKFGWWVFPCRPDGKAPATREGLLNATNDPNVCRIYWSRHPDANIAVRTGAESQVVVLDVDGDEGTATLRQFESEYGVLPQTASIVTPRGGTHFYFQHPGVEIRNTAGAHGELGVGLDFRGDGGYVLAPPSRVLGRAYEIENGIGEVGIAPLPEWLRKRLIERQRRSRTTIDQATWLGLIGTELGEGERNTQLFRIAGYLSRNMDDGVALGILHIINEAKCRPSLKRVEVDQIMQSQVASRLREMEGRR
jgi:hypothetical protein